jgi:hypothetical protein
MAKIRSLLNAGKNFRIGDTSINCLNVDPTAKVAGTDSINANDLKKYEFFNITSSAATANILLNDDIPVGAQFTLYVGANGFEIIGGGTGLLNGGTAAQVIDIAASSQAQIVKTSATTYTVHQVTAAGAITAPAPAADG